MSVLEQIDAKVSQLPPELQAEVLDFVQFLIFKRVEKSPANQQLNERLPNKRGAGKKVITYVADDFDAPLDDFKGYM